MSDTYNPMDCIPPGSSDHGIFQARILEWVVTPGDLTNPAIELGLLHCRQIPNHLSCKGILEVKWLDPKREF